MALPSSCASLRGPLLRALPASHPAAARSRSTWPISPERPCSSRRSRPDALRQREAPSAPPWPVHGRDRRRAGSLVAVLAQVSLGMGIRGRPERGGRRRADPQRDLSAHPRGARFPPSVAAVFRANELSPPVRRFIEQVRLSPPDEPQGSWVGSLNRSWSQALAHKTERPQGRPCGRSHTRRRPSDGNSKGRVKPERTQPHPLIH